MEGIHVCVFISFDMNLQNKALNSQSLESSTSYLCIRIMEGMGGLPSSQATSPCDSTGIPRGNLILPQKSVPVALYKLCHTDL